MAVSKQVKERLRHAQERVMAARVALGRIYIEDAEEAGILEKLHEVRAHYKLTAEKTEELLDMIDGAPKALGVNGEEDDAVTG